MFARAVACGADAVMIGSPFAKTEEAPAKGMHWGMATWHESLPRGTRIDLGVKYTLDELLFGPSSTSDGTLNLRWRVAGVYGLRGGGDDQGDARRSDGVRTSYQDRGQDLPDGGRVRTASTSNRNSSDWIGLGD